MIIVHASSSITDSGAPVFYSILEIIVVDGLRLRRPSLLGSLSSLLYYADADAILAKRCEGRGSDTSEHILWKIHRIST